jgi:hypothetical protein
MDTRALRLVLAAVGAAAVGAAWACSSSSSRPAELGGTPGSDAGFHGGSSSGGGDGGGGDAGSTCSGQDGGCNALLNCGPQVFVQQSTQTAPTPTGGAVPDGTYVVTSYTLYIPGGTAGTSSDWFRETLQIGTPSMTDGGADSGEAGVPDDDAGDAGETTGFDAAPGPVAWAEISESNTSPANTTNIGTVAFSSSAMAIFFTCPSGLNPFQASFTYSTATNTLLIFTPFDEDGGQVGTGVATYTKQ